MKTIFALLGLFMFTSVSSTDVTNTSKEISPKSQLTLEHGNQVGGNKKDSALIGLSYKGNQVGGNKKDSALIGLAYGGNQVGGNKKDSALIGLS